MGSYRRSYGSLRKPAEACGSLRKPAEACGSLRKPAEAYGNPTEDQEAKPRGNHAEACRNPTEAYGKPTEDLVAHTFFWVTFFSKTAKKTSRHSSSRHFLRAFPPGISSEQN